MRLAPAGELRGAWLARDSLDSRESIARAMDALAGANFNVRELYVGLKRARLVLAVSNAPGVFRFSYTNFLQGLPGLAARGLARLRGSPDLSPHRSGIVQHTRLLLPQELQAELDRASR